MIHDLRGDATSPVAKPAMIAHVCNDQGAWGAGFVLALSKKWPEPEKDYKSLTRRRLGFVQFSKVEPDIYVANMLAQHGFKTDHDSYGPPVQYWALWQCLESVNWTAEKAGLSVHMPYIGAGLGGGDWKAIRALIEAAMTVDTYLYEYEG